MNENPFNALEKQMAGIKKDQDRILEILQEKIAPPPQVESYLKSDDVCELLGISRVSLWTWDKKGITKPVYFGSQKRYRLSDIEKMATASQPE